MADWSELHWDLLSLILDRLTLLDFIHFGAVCTSWRALSRGRGYPGSVPWLLVLGDDEERKTPVFYSISEQMTHRLMIPELYGRRCWGCSNGWVVTQDINLEMHLVQPFSGIRVQIPSPPPFTEDNDDGCFSPEDLLQLNILRVFLSSDPVSCPEDCLIMAVHGARGKLTFLRLGDEKWTVIKDEFGMYWDVLYFRGQFLATTSLQHIVACELGPDPRTRIFAPRVWRDGCDRRYLVESEGDLLYVIRNFSVCPTPEFVRVLSDSEIDSDDSDDERVRYHVAAITSRFEVLKLDTDTREWLEVTSLGDRALFVGQGMSMSLSARDLPGCKENSIYFTDSEPKYDHHGYYDLGVYNLGDGTVEHFYPTNVIHPLLSPPSWFYPSHFYKREPM